MICNVVKAARRRDGILFVRVMAERVVLGDVEFWLADRSSDGQQTRRLGSYHRTRISGTTFSC